MHFNTTWTDRLGRNAHLSSFASAQDAANAEGLMKSFVQVTVPMTDATFNGVNGLEDPPPGFTSALHFPGRLGFAGHYDTVEFKAVMSFVDFNGNIHRWQIPAPKLSIFLSDAVTVDQSNAAVLAFNSFILNANALLSFISSRDQVGMEAFLGGLLVRRKKQRRETIIWRNPTDTGPAE